MKKILVTILAIFCVNYSLNAADFSLKQELDASEIEKLNKGENIIKLKELENGTWPEITIYKIIDSTPLNAMGIFSALDYQKEYVPNIIKSKPIKHISSVEVLTEYEMHVPFPLSNAKYIHGSIIHKYQNDYELTWYKVESSSTEEVKGSAYFTSLNNKTLFRYRSYIKPKSFFASFVKKIMLKDVEKSVNAIVSHIEKLEKEKSPLLAKYSKFINDSLNGDLVYKNLIGNN